jgi:hypothetical protein
LGTVESFGVIPVRTAVRSPWQNGVAERFVGNCRRDLLDHVIVLNERHLKRLMTDYIRYYHEDRTHLGLAKQTPSERKVDEIHDAIGTSFQCHAWTAYIIVTSSQPECSIPLPAVEFWLESAWPLGTQCVQERCRPRRLRRNRCFVFRPSPEFAVSYDPKAFSVRRGWHFGETQLPNRQHRERSQRFPNRILSKHLTRNQSG